MKHACFATTSGILALTLCAPLAAQSINPALDRGQRESQIVGAITVPLGQSNDARRVAPRFEIISRSRASDSIATVITRDNELRWQEHRVGFTIDGSDALMLNGRPLDAGERRDNISTLGAIAIGVGALLVASAFYLGDKIDDISSNDG